MKNDTVCKQNGSTVFLKEREQYFEIQDLKAQLQDKNIAISELKKLIEKMKRKTVDTKFDKPSAVRQPNALKIPKPSEYVYKTIVKAWPQLRTLRMKEKIIQLILFIVDSGCIKHMMRNLKLLCNFVEKYLGTVRFRNYQFSPILGYGDLVQGNIMIKRVYYVEGLNHNLFLVGQLCDADLEVAFRRSTCLVRDLKGNDLLTDNLRSDLYIISLQETSSPTPICFLAKASPTQACLPKLKYVKDQLCSPYELGKAKRSTFKTKTVPISKRWLTLLYIDLCGPIQIESINGKKYILEIVDDYSRYTWTLFLRTKDKTP
ncbi:retrovirus-related pol polyprotein from transposon TNT 1-94 [Tanacetum coccineum]